MSGSSPCASPAVGNTLAAVATKARSSVTHILSFFLGIGVGLLIAAECPPSPAPVDCTTPTEPPITSSKVETKTESTIVKEDPRKGSVN